MRGYRLMAGGVFSAFALLGSAGRAGAEITNVDIGINPTYEQTGPTTVTSTGGFFSARAFLASASDFDGGTLAYPGAGSPAPLTPQPGPIVGYSVGDSSFADLNTAFPFGTYTFDATNSMTSDSQTATIDYTTAATPLSIPRLSAASYNGLQGLNSASGFTFDFNSFVQNPSGNLAFVFLNVIDSGGNDVFSQGFLGPTTTSIFMPGGSLAAGQAYTFDLIFDDRITGTDGVTPNTIFFDAHTDGTFTTAAVPEPGTWAILALGFAGLGGVLRRKSARTAGLA
jgi:hypothetical protein